MIDFYAPEIFVEQLFERSTVGERPKQKQRHQPTGAITLWIATAAVTASMTIAMPLAGATDASEQRLSPQAILAEAETSVVLSSLDLEDELRTLSSAEGINLDIVLRGASRLFAGDLITPRSQPLTDDEIDLLISDDETSIKG